MWISHNDIRLINIFLSWSSRNNNCIIYKIFLDFFLLSSSCKGAHTKIFINPPPSTFYQKLFFSPIGTKRLVSTFFNTITFFWLVLCQDFLLSLECSSFFKRRLFFYLMGLSVREILLKKNGRISFYD